MVYELGNSTPLKAENIQVGKEISDGQMKNGSSPGDTRRWEV